MGWGTFNTSSYVNYSNSVTRNLDGTEKSLREVFKQREIHESLDPSKIVIRESCDSDDSPMSLPIIIALDVTGSMGYIAQSMVSTQLGSLMEGIINEPSIKYPHMMFMAVGDIACDRVPLQVSQFEADIRIAQQLTQIFVEGGGGGNDTESYDLPWYFAAKKTKTDSFNKRGKKGYIFTIGDEMPPNGVRKEQFSKVFGSSLQESTYSAADLLNMAEEQYDVFHIIVEEGNYARYCLNKVVSAWKNLLGRKALCLNDYTKLSEVIVSAIRVNEGEDPDNIINSIQDTSVKKAVSNAFYKGNTQ